MKKRSIWMVFLATLLCMTILLVSCKSANTDSETDGTETTDQIETTESQENTQPEETEEAKAENEKVDYLGNITAWAKCISFKAPEARPLLSATTTPQSDYELYRDGILSVCVYDGSGVTFKYYEHFVCNLKTGEQVFKEIISYDYADRDNESVRSINIDTLADGAIFCVDATYEIYDEATLSYNSYHSYRYYDANGEMLQSFENQLQGQNHMSENGPFVVIGDKCYVCANGEIVTVFNATELRGIPEKTHEHKDFIYSITDRNIWVMNGEYEELLRYDVEGSWDYTQSYILSNGDLFVQYEKANKFENNQNYNVEDSFGEKYLVKQVLISVENNKVTELEPSFIVEDLISAAEDNVYNVTVNGDYQVALVHKIGENNIASNENTYVVLNNAMAITEELPEMMKNQSKLLAAKDTNTFVITTEVTNGYYNYNETPEVYKYLISKADGKIKLYVSGEQGNYTFVDGGFIYEDVLYNDDMRQLVDLKSAPSYEVRNGIIFVKEKDVESSYRVLYIRDGNYYYSNSIYMPNGFSMGDDYFTVSHDSDGSTKTYMYNVIGTLILGADQVSILENYSDGFDGMLVQCTNSGYTGSTYYFIK